MRLHVKTESAGGGARVNSQLNIVEADNISKTYTINNREISVLKDVTLAVVTGEFLVDPRPKRQRKDNPAQPSVRTGQAVGR